MNKSIKGGLTPRTNKTIEAMRFSGAFGSDEGFASVLEATVKEDGSLALSLHFPSVLGSKIDMLWGVELTCDQRNAFAKLISGYQPLLYEQIVP